MRPSRASSARASHSDARGKTALPFRERSASVATADSSQPVYSLYTVLGRKKKRFPAFVPKIFIDVTNVTDISIQYGQMDRFSRDIWSGYIYLLAATFITWGSVFFSTPFSTPVDKAVDNCGEIWRKVEGWLEPRHSRVSIIFCSRLLIIADRPTDRATDYGARAILRKLTTLNHYLRIRFYPQANCKAVDNFVIKLL